MFYKMLFVFKRVGDSTSMKAVVLMDDTWMKMTLPNDFFSDSIIVMVNVAFRVLYFFLSFFQFVSSSIFSSFLFFFFFFFFFPIPLSSFG